MIIDIIIIIVLLASSLLAFLRGFIRESLTLLGVVGGLAAAYTGGPVAAQYLKDWMGVKPESDNAEKFMDVLPYPYLAEGIAYFGIFLIVVVILSLFSHFLSASAQKIGLGLVDRTLGVIFGLARGLLLLALLYLPFHLFTSEEEQEKWFGKSRAIIYVEWTALWIADFLPESFVDEDMQKQADQTREKLKSLELLPELKQVPNIQGESEQDQSTDQGYEDNQRRSLEELIQEQGNEQDHNAGK